MGPGQYAVVTVKVHAGTQLGDTLAHLKLRTDFEQVQIPAHMRVEHGSLQVTPDPVVFNDCFPVGWKLGAERSLPGVCRLFWGKTVDPVKFQRKTREFEGYGVSLKQKGALKFVQEGSV